MRLSTCVAIILVLSCTRAAADATAASTVGGAEACRDTVMRLIGAIREHDWDRLASVVDRHTSDRLDTEAKLFLQTDRRGLMRVLSTALHPGRARRNVRVEPKGDSGTHFLVIQTAPYTYIDEPMESDSAPCEEKPVELCVQLVTDESGETRLRLTYPLHDILYLLQ